jgi:hypothetical protein
MQKYQEVVASQSTGKPVYQASVVVKNYPSLTLATYYATNSTSTPLTVPILTDAAGNFGFYAADGHYQIEITVTGQPTVILSDILLQDSATGLANISTSAGATLVGTAPAGGLVATQVQASLTELDNEKMRIDTLAASSGSSLVGYLPEGTGAVATTVANQLNITACDLNATGSVDAANISSLPCYAAVSVNLNRTVLDRHAFEDWTTITASSGTPLGYASFDAKPSYTNTTAQLHLVSYQARPTFSGSANLNQYWHGYDTAMVHNGTGVVTEASGINIRDITGTGKANITNFYGVFIATQTAGVSRYGIYSDAGNSHMLGGFTGSVFTGTIQASGLNYNNDNVSKTISIGFGTAGQTQFGTINFYNGKNAVVASIQSTGLVVTGTSNASGITKSGSYTVATLPAASEGFVAYCTNGRKVGEGVGAGTGVPVYYSGGIWRVFSTDALVLA